MKRKRAVSRKAWAAKLKLKQDQERQRRQRLLAPTAWMLQWDLSPELIRPGDRSYSKPDKQAEREAGLRSRNSRVQQEAKNRRREYFEIIEMLHQRDPRLRSAKPHKLAPLIQAELKKRGRVSASTGKPDHIRTIQRGITPKK